VYEPVGISNELMSNASNSLLIIGEYLGMQILNLMHLCGDHASTLLCSCGANKRSKDIEFRRGS
jgi:hypothetical protein